MNLYLRKIWTVLRAFFKPPVQIGETIEIRRHVWLNDIDINGHMNNGRYQTIVDLQLIEYFIRCGFFRTLVKNGWRPMLGGSIVHFRRGLKPFQAYTLRFRVVSWDERWNYMSFEFVRNGEIAASGISKGAVVGPRGFVGNAAAFAAMGLPGISPQEPEGVTRWREADALLISGAAV